MKTINKKILNNNLFDQYIGDVLLYESNNLSEFDIDLNNASLFRSGRQKK